MAANNSNGGAQAPGAISVAVTTQGSEAGINALNQSLQAMGGLLATVNNKLEENEARLVKLNKNANALAATIGGQSRIASTALKNQAIADQGDAGVLLKQQNFLAGQQAAFAKSLNSQAKVQAEETLRSSRFKGGSAGLLGSVKSGTLSSKDLRQVALATKAMAEQEGKAKLLERSNATLRMLDKYDQQILKLKEAEVKAKKDQAVAERKLLADQRTARVKEIRESTAAWRISNAQEQANLGLVNTPKGMALVQAGARASTEGRAARGFRQQQAERVGKNLESSGQLMGPNRKRYWDGSDLSASKNGIPQIQGMLQQAQLHVQALERKANRSGAGVTERATIKQEQDKIGLEISQLTKALNALTARTYANSATGQGVAKLNSVDKANARLSGVDLSGARNVAGASTAGLTGTDFKFRKEDINKARSQSQSAMDLAKNAGNQTAYEDAKNLNRLLREQWTIVDGLSKAETARSNAAKKATQEAERKAREDAKTAAYNATAKGQINAAAESANLAEISTTTGKGFMNAASRRAAEKRSQSGAYQLEIEAFSKKVGDNIVGANRPVYFKKDTDPTQIKGGLPAMENLLKQAGLHREVLLRRASDPSLTTAQRAEASATLPGLNTEIRALSTSLKALNGELHNQSAAGKGVNRVRAMGKLREVNLTDAVALSTASNTGLSEGDAAKRLRDLTEAAKQAKTAAGLAEKAGNDKAMIQAKALNDLLHERARLLREILASEKAAATQAKTAATAKYQFMQMNEQAGLAALNNPSQAPFLGAAATASMDAKVRQGMNRVRAGNDIAALQQQGVLVGPKAADAYYKGGADYTGQSATQLQERLRGLDRHREALKLAGTDLGKYKVTLEQITVALAALKLQEQDLNRILSARTKLDFQNSASGRAQDVNKAKATLAGMNLAPATALAAGSVTGLSEDKWMEKKLAIQTQLGQAQKAYNLATIAGDNAAIKSAEALIAKLQAQRAELKAMEDLKRNAASAAAKEKVKFDTLSNQTFRTNSIDSQIKGAKTVLELERLKRDEIGKQLTQATQLETLAKKRGDTATQERAAKLVAQYSTEQNQISERIKQIKDEGKYARAYQERLTPEGQGSSFLNRAALLKDYMLMGSITGSIAGGYGFLKDFEAALKQTQAIAQGTERQMQGLRGAILDVSDSSRFSAIELTEATTILAQAGFSISEIQTSLTSVATLATATGSTLKDSVDIATSVMGAFKMSSTTMPEVVNQITQAINLSKLDIPKFMLATQYAGNAASDLGVSFREMLTATAAVSNTGIRSGSTMGTGMRQLLADLTSPTDKMKKKLIDLGLSFRDVDVRINGLTGVMKNLKEAGFSTADAFDSFELRAAAYYVALSNNLSSYDQMYAQMDDQTAASKAQEIQMNSLAAQTDRMTNQFKIAADVLGKDLRNSLTAVFRGTADLTEGFNKLADDGALSVGVNLLAMTAVFTASILVFRNLMVVLSGVVSLLAAKKAALIETGKAARFLMLGLTLPWIIGIAAGIATVVMITSRWQTEQEKLSEAVEKSTSIYKSAQETVAGYNSSVTEIDEKMKSLSARTSSLGDNQADLAVEFDIVRRKALELGIDLKTKVENTVVSLKEAWVEMRTEMQKRIYVDMQYEGFALENKQTTERAAYAGQLADLRQFESSETLSPSFKYFDAKENKFLNINGSNTPTSEAFTAALMSTTAGAFTVQNPDPKAVRTPGEILEDSSGNRESKLNLNQLLSKLEQSMIDPGRLSVLMPEMEVLYSKISQDVNAVTRNLAKIIASTDDVDIRNDAMAQQQVFSRYFTDPTNKKGLGYFFASARNISAQQRVLDSQSFDTRAAGVAAEGPSGSLTQNSRDYMELLNLKGLVESSAKTASLKLFETYKKEFIAASVASGVPASVLVAKSFRESSGNPNALSPRNALGLGQMQPSAAASVGYTHEEMRDPSKSIMAAALYLQKTIKNVKIIPGKGGQVVQGIRAYHSGLGAWEKQGRDIGPINEAYAPGIGALAAAISEAVDGRQIVREGVEQTDQQRELSAEITLRKDQSLSAAHILELIETALEKNTALAEILYRDSTAFKAELANLEAKGFEPGTSEAKRAEELKANLVKIAAQAPTVEATIQRERENKLRVQAMESINQKELSIRYVEQAQLLAADKQDSSLARDKELLQMQIDKITLETKLVTLQGALYRQKPEDGLEAYNAMEAEVFALQKQIAFAESRRKQIADSEQGTSSSAFLMSDNALLLNDKELQQQMARLTLESQNRKIEAAKRYKEHVRKITQEAFDLEVELMKKSTAENKRQLDVRQKDFEDYNAQVALNNRLGVDKMKYQRTRMDLTENRGKYTEGERSALDEKIRLEEEYIADTLARDLLVTRLTEANTRLNKLVLDNGFNQASVDILRERSMNPLINETEAEQRANAAKIKELEDLIRDQGVEINRATDTVISLERETAVNSSDNPEQSSFGSQLQQHYSKQWEDRQSRASLYNDVKSSVDSIGSGFAGLTDNLMNATAGVEDFFRAFIGRSKEGKEAWRSFGMGILQTMMKIVTDRITAQFMSILFGTAEDPTKLATAGGGVVDFLLGTGKTIAMSALGPSAAVGSGMNFNMASPSAPIPMMANLMADGGKITGGLPNRDSVPIMAMAGEYVLPKHTSNYLGEGFLEGLRNKPEATMKSFAGASAAMGGGKSVNQSTNVYVVSPDKVPAGMSRDDVIVTIADDINRNGPIKQLIKQVNHRG